MLLLFDLKTLNSKNKNQLDIAVNKVKYNKHHDNFWCTTFTQTLKSKFLMGKKGFEPLTLRLSGVYSYQLSYLPPVFAKSYKQQLPNK